MISRASSNPNRMRLFSFLSTNLADIRLRKSGSCKARNRTYSAIRTELNFKPFML